MQCAPKGTPKPRTSIDWTPGVTRHGKKAMLIPHVRFLSDGETVSRLHFQNFDNDRLHDDALPPCPLLADVQPGARGVGKPASPGHPRPEVGPVSCPGRCLQHRNPFEIWVRVVSGSASAPVCSHTLTPPTRPLRRQCHAPTGHAIGPFPQGGARVRQTRRGQAGREAGLLPKEVRTSF